MAQVRHGAVWQGGGAGHGFGNQAAQAVGQGILRGAVVQVGGEAGEQAKLALAAGLQGEGDGRKQEKERQGGEEGEALAGVAGHGRTQETSPWVGSVHGGQGGRGEGFQRVRV